MESNEEEALFESQWLHNVENSSQIGNYLVG